MRLDRVGEHRTAFDKNRKIVLATQNICGICGLEIDPSFKSPHPLSATVDHIIPVSKGGHPSDLSNLQAAHRVCNQQKRDKLFLEENKKISEIKSDNILTALPQHADWRDYKVTILETQSVAKE